MKGLLLMLVIGLNGCTSTSKKNLKESGVPSTHRERFFHKAIKPYPGKVPMPFPGKSEVIRNPVYSGW